MVDLRVNLPGSEKDQPKFNYSSPVEAPGAMKVAAGKSGFASAVEGVAAIGGGLVELVDKTFEGLAGEEVERAVDQVREEFAVNGDLYGGRDITNDPQTTPEIEKSLKYAREINQGYMAGTIKDSNYWARLDSISRQLRTRYPGYRDYIDQKMSSMVGGTPANRLREQLAEEARAAARDKAESSPLEKLRWSTLSDLVKDGIQDRVNPNWQKQIQDGTFDWEENMRVGAALRFSEYETRVKQNNINLLQDDAELAKANAKVEARKEATVFVNTAVLGGATAQGKKVSDMISGFKKMAAEGKLPTGPELEQQLSNINGLRLSITDGINKMLDSQWKDHPNQSYSNFLDGNERKEILENALAPITAMEQFLRGEDVGVLDRYATSLKYMTDGDSKRMAEVDDNIRMMMSVSKTIGPEGMALLYQNSEVLSSISNTLSDSMISHLVTGKSDSVVQTIRTIRDSQGAGAKQVDQSVSLLKDRLISFLSSDSADVETFRTLSNALFNDKENLLSMVNTEQGAKILGQLTAPGVATRMKEMTVYDPAIWKNYERWATKGFLYLNQSAMQTMKDVKVNRKYVDLVYDPKKMVFSEQPRKPTGSTILDSMGWDVLKGVQSVSESYFGRQGKKAIDDLNISFANFKAFAEEAGIDPVSITSQALAANGFDPKAVYEGPAIPTTMELGSMIADAIVRGVQNPPNIELDPETQKILDGDPKDQDRLNGGAGVNAPGGGSGTDPFADALEIDPKVNEDIQKQAKSLEGRRSNIEANLKMDALEGKVDKNRLSNWSRGEWLLDTELRRYIGHDSGKRFNPEIIDDGIEPVDVWQTTDTDVISAPQFGYYAKYTDKKRRNQDEELGYTDWLARGYANRNDPDMSFKAWFDNLPQMIERKKREWIEEQKKNQAKITEKKWSDFLDSITPW